MKMNRFIATRSVLAALLTTSAPSWAVPLDYAESRAGDLAFPAPAFVLDAGSNTLSGTTHFNLNSPGLPRFDTDFDSFAFELPAGLQLIGLSLSFLTTTFNVATADLELRLCGGITTCGLDPAELLGSADVDLLGTTPQSVDFALRAPLSGGTFSLFASGLGIGVADAGIAQANWSSDYTWTLAVQRISEPGILQLLTLGFAGLLWSQRARLRAG